ncbi:hypothetical protein DW170_11055 [Bacteroides fragilis]|nr:hypothetical protein DW170_11055 [Bacteroides fragilis]
MHPIKDFHGGKVHLLTNRSKFSEEKFKKKEKTLDFCSPMSYLYYQNHKVRSIYIRNERGRLLLPFFMESLHPTSP